jgi:hypothetical protein
MVAQTTASIRAPTSSTTSFSLFDIVSYRSESLAKRKEAISFTKKTGSPELYFYTGSHNPSITALEQAVAAIESAPPPWPLRQACPQSR